MTDAEDQMITALEAIRVELARIANALERPKPPAVVVNSPPLAQPVNICNLDAARSQREDRRISKTEEHNYGPNSAYGFPND